jgi:carbonic anhydrase/acetyltransferase-like protein (isoleucine patch superfamily)
MGTVDKTVYEATGSAIIGDVTIGAESSIWFNAVVRGDEASVNIGRRTSIQDNAVVHTDIDCPVIIGDDVSVGHGAIVHGCTIGDNTIVGMGSIVLNGAHVGSNCISPAKIARAITAEEISANKENASLYVGLARDARTNDLIDAISPTGD